MNSCDSFTKEITRFTGLQYEKLTEKFGLLLFFWADHHFIVFDYETRTAFLATAANVVPVEFLCIHRLFAILIMVQ